MSYAKIFFLLLLGFFFFFCSLALRPFGRPYATTMDKYFITHAQSEDASNNVVASVVFDYRGLDTLGEATVLFAALSSIVLLFRGAFR